MPSSLSDALRIVFMAVCAFYASQPATTTMPVGIISNLKLMYRCVYDARVSRWTVLSIGCQVIERSPASADIQVQAAIVAARKALQAYNV